MASRARQLSKLLSSDLLTVDVNNNRIGVNSTAPATTLDVVGQGEPAPGKIRLIDPDTALSDGELSSAIEFAQNDTSDPNSVNASIRAIGDGSIGNMALAFHTGQDVEKVRITSAGRVGIGFSSPLGKLHVRAADECNFIVREESTSLVLSAETNSGRDNNRLMTLEGSGFVFNVGGSEKLRITSGGAVQTTGADDQDNLVVNGGSTQFAVHQDDTDGEVSLRAQDGSGSNNTKFMTFFTEGGSGPTERLRIDVNGNLKLGTATLGPPSSGPPTNTFFVGSRAAIRSVSTTTTLDGSGDGSFNLGRLHYNDDESFELFMSICTTADTNLKTSYCKAFCQKVRGTGLTDFFIDRQDSAASGFSVSSLSSTPAQGTNGHGLLVNVTGGSANTEYRITMLVHSVSKNNLYS